MSSLCNVHVKTAKSDIYHIISVEYSREKNMMVGYAEASVPLSVRIESCKQAAVAALLLTS